MERMRNEESLILAWLYGILRLRLAAPNSKLSRMTNGQWVVRYGIAERYTPNRGAICSYEHDILPTAKRYALSGVLADNGLSAIV